MAYVYFSDADAVVHKVHSDLTSDPLHDPTRYAPTVLFMVDACEHTRDRIDYVRTSTNELYAKRLDGLQAQVDKLIAGLNPTKHVDTMKLLMNDFDRIHDPPGHKIP